MMQNQVEAHDLFGTIRFRGEPIANEGIDPSPSTRLDRSKVYVQGPRSPALLFCEGMGEKPAAASDVHDDAIITGIQTDKIINITYFVFNELRIIEDRYFLIQ